MRRGQCTYCRLPLCNLIASISFLQDFFKLAVFTFLLDLSPEFYFPVVASPLKLQYSESAAHRVKPQSVTVGDIGAVLSAVQNYKNETRAKFFNGHGESRPLLTISGGLLSQGALIFQNSESVNYTTDNIDLSHWYKVDKVFYTPEAKLRCVKITSYITKRS